MEARHGRKPKKPQPSNPETPEPAIVSDGNGEGVVNPGEVDVWEETMLAGENPDLLVGS